LTPDAVAALRVVLGACDLQQSASIAVHTAAVSLRLSQHIGRLVGELGMRTLFERSLHLSGATHPCFRRYAKGSAPYDALRTCLEQEQPGEAFAASMHVLTTFIELIERFLGEGLGGSLLRELWADAFASIGAKETK